MFADLITPEQITILTQIILIDLVMRISDQELKKIIKSYYLSQ